MPEGALFLTAAGIIKLGSFVAAVRQALQIGLAREAQEFRAVAAAGAPSPEAEAVLLSRGVPGSGPGQVGVGGGIAGGVIGTPEGGRFLRQGAQVSLREAILTDRIVQTTTPDRVTAGTGNPGVINQKTGFFWQTRRRGIQGPTEPFNHAYVQAAENGGVVWVVRPRSGTRGLEPEPGIITHTMVKTMPPFQMYRRSLFTQREIARQRLSVAVRAAAREVGRA
mgnify:FL=1